MVGYEGYYAVSDCGRVRSLDRTAKHSRGGPRSIRGRVLRATRSSGYLRVPLSVDASACRRRIHVLVCEAFHGPKPSKYHHAAHIDGNRDNNRAANLRWATPKENLLDKVLHGTVSTGESHGLTYLTDAAVNMIRAAYRSGNYDQYKLASMFGTTQNVVSSVTTGKTWGHLPRSWDEL